MLVELGLVEQRYRAVSEVLFDNASVTEVARRYGVVARQTVHVWLRRNPAGGDGRAGGWQLAAGVVSASDASGGEARIV